MKPVAVAITAVATVPLFRLSWSVLHTLGVCAGLGVLVSPDRIWRARDRSVRFRAPRWDARTLRAESAPPPNPAGYTPLALFVRASRLRHPVFIPTSFTFPSRSLSTEQVHAQGRGASQRNRVPQQPSHPVSPVPVSTRGVGFARVRRAASLGPDWGWHLCVEDRTARSRLRTLRRPHDGTMKGSSVRARAARRFRRRGRPGRRRECAQDGPLGAEEEEGREGSDRE